MADERQIKREVVFEGSAYDVLPDDLVGVIRWFRKRLAEIPKEHRNSAICHVSADSYYDSPYPTIRISYARRETDFECAQRLIGDMAMNRLDREAELSLLRTLRKKYGDEEV